MQTERGFADREALAPAVRAAFGPGRSVTGVDRLRGGSKKGVYRLTLDDGATTIAYVWSAAENYWQPADARAAAPGPGGSEPDPADPFSPGSGLDLFQAAHRRLTALGVRSPEVFLVGPAGTYHPADVALVQDVRGGTLEALMERSPEAAAPVLARLADQLDVMGRHTAPRYGKVALLDAGGTATGASCEQVVLDRALLDLDEAAGRDPRIAAERDRLADLALELAAAVRPRAEHALIHGELGPDHVLVDDRGQPVLIDIEGLMHFDVEWEHVFLRIRFAAAYPALARPDLDPRRLALYALAMRLSLVAGPLRLLDGDFPDRRFMRNIAEHNLGEALALLPQRGPSR